MVISINRKKIDFSIEKENTLGDVLGALEAECEKAGMTINRVRIDDIDIPSEQLDPLFSQKIESISTIELETLSGEDVLSMLRDLGARFSAGVPILQNIPVLLQTGKDLQVLNSIHAFSLDLQKLYQLLPLLNITGRDPNSLEIEGVALETFPSELSPVLKELLEALEIKDSVLVGDLSEYELAPRIEKLGIFLSSI